LIRVSGPTAEEIAKQLFHPLPPENFLSHHLYHGKIISPTTGAILDEVLIALLKGPHSYTGEDTLEISCHGGPLILRTVLEAVFQTGARPAERGEFTQRAFLNNRLDLAQAEAVLDIITAKTRQGLAAAIDCLARKLSEQVEAVRSEMIDLLAGIEAGIDFPEDDGAGETPDEALPRIRKLIDKITALAATHRQGQIYREGIGVVIAGRPNVGKSSLLNRILGEKRAIVNPIPGTTRDFIEETVDIGGIPVRLTDTAGLRLPENAIEKEGVDLVWERLKTADAVLVLLDGSADLTADDRELLVKMISKPMLPVLNKSDLPQRLDEKSLRRLLPEGTPPAIRISAKYGEGLDRLTAALRDLVLATPAEEYGIIVEPAGSLRAMPGFSEGAFSVQDLGAQLAVPLLQDLPGQRVLDACAAPGGKTLVMAGILSELYPEARILANELSSDRRRRLVDVRLADTLRHHPRAIV
jgi:tRNA modification GTPase